MSTQLTISPIIDYAKPYTPKIYSREFFTWDKLYLENEGLPTPKIHYAAIDELYSCDKDFLAEFHREAAKSTLFSKKLLLYVAHKGEFRGKPKRNIMIISATHEQAVDLIADLKMAWESSDKLQEELPLAKTNRGKAMKYTEREVVFQGPHGRVYIQAKSALSAMRGTKREKKRIQLGILDDILNDRVLKSVEEALKIIEWYSSVFYPAMDSANKDVVTVGTPMTTYDLIALMKKDPTIASFQIPIMKNPEALKDKDAKIISSWKALHSEERIRKDYERAKALGTVSSFMREKLLQVVSEDQQLFSVKARKVPGFDMSSMTTFMGVMKEETDSWRGGIGIVVVGLDRRNRLCLLEAKQGILNIKESLNLILDWDIEYTPDSIVMDAEFFVEFESSRELIEFKRKEYFSDVTKVTKTQKKFKGYVSALSIWIDNMLINRKAEDGEEFKNQLENWTIDGPSTRFFQLVGAMSLLTVPEGFYTKTRQTQDDDFFDDESDSEKLY